MSDYQSDQRFDGCSDVPASEISQEDLSAFADGELSPSRARLVVAHLRRNPEAAQQVCETWRMEADVLRQLNSALGVKDCDDTGNRRRATTAGDSSVARNWPMAPWLSGVAAGVLFALGLWVGNLDAPAEAPLLSGSGFETPADPAGKQLSVGAQLRAEEQDRLDGMGVALVPVSAVAPDTGAADINTPAQPNLSAPEGSAQGPMGDSLLPQQDTLPKSAHPAPQGYQLHFQSADGRVLTLERFSLDNAPGVSSQEQPAIAGQGEQSERALRAQSGQVHWVHGRNFYVLSGDYDAAGMFAVALSLREQQAAENLNALPVAPRATESVQDPALSRSLTGAMDTGAAEAAPGFSKM